MVKKKINNIATRDDLKNLATKDDLQEVRNEMATKDDLKRFATKEDLQQTEQKFKNELWEVEQKFEDKLEGTFRKYRDDTLKGLDKIMGELQTFREEQTIHNAQHDRIDERLDRLEEHTDLPALK